jgi:5-oxoprolinase (ATP-hydrolysing) subunit B
MRLLPAGDRAVLAEVDDLGQVHALASAVRAAALPGVVDVVPGYRTVLVTADAHALPAVRDALPRLAAAPAPASPPRTVVVDVVYDGQDLAEVCRLTGLSGDEVVARHTAPEYVVAFLGFAPGFPYLVGLDPALHVPRRATPRTRVPAGSVGLAGPQTGVYPVATPGGWQLVGRTDAVLFDAGRDPPALLAAGDRLRFRAVGP